ncbi:MAG: nicotinate (nicotinamide) nucleotide adenylyltransferase [Proteobacteria bacterium]|nr:nicotinate (nicotinamide) nucleotide adenylyltransferase [Pseudomonadota bacterium]
MVRIGLLGGSFNPPHLCHVRLSEYVLQSGAVDAVWWLPVHRHAFDKDASLASWDDRLAMAEAAVADHPDLHVDPIESTLAPPSYTVHTIAALRERHPEHTFVWLAGADILPELHLWHRWSELRELLEFLIVGRGDRARDAPEGARIDVRDFTLPDISSSQVRRRLAAGDRAAARELVPAAVADWLDAHPDVYA